MRRRGMALVIVLQILAVIMVIGLAFMLTSDTNTNFLRQERRSLQAMYNAEAGVKLVIKDLYDRLGGATVTNANNPFDVVDAYHNKTITGSITGPDGKSTGTYSVTCTVNPSTGAPLLNDSVFLQYKTVTLNGTGTMDGVRRTVRATVKAGYKQPEPFQYAAYTNNYWYCGTIGGSLIINGNHAVNGYSDLRGNTSPLLNGNPVYDQTGKAVSAGGRTANLQFRPPSSPYTGSWQGYGATNYQSYAPFIQMPSLARMDYFALVANASTGTITRGGAPLVTKVFGQSGLKNIVLDGSVTPIQINGTVVIMGDCILKGQISGQGTLYVGRNLYIAGNVTYTTHYSARPIYNTSTDTPETYYNNRLKPWMQSNVSAPCVSYCVAKNVVLCDVSDSNWWNGWTNVSTGVSYPGISSWMTATPWDNASIRYADMHEDMGNDRVWGSLSEASENDNKWTVQVDDGTQIKTMDLSVSGGVAQVPSGSTVVPGTGEDVDGDGKYTVAYGYDDYRFRDALDNPTSTVSSANFSGWNNGYTYNSFVGSSVSAMSYPTHIDGFIYCNHTIMGWMGNGSTNVIYHGGYACRQSGLRYNLSSSNSVTIEHDDRVVQKGQFGQVLPGAAALQTTEWKMDQ